MASRDDLLDVPEVMPHVMAVVSRHVLCTLLAAGYMINYYVFGQRLSQHHRPTPTAELKRPRSYAQRYRFIPARRSKFVGVITLYLANAGQADSLNPLRPVPQVVSHVTDVLRHRPGARLAAPIACGVTSDSVQRIGRVLDEIDCVGRRGRPVEAALTARLPIQRSAPLLHPSNLMGLSEEQSRWAVSSPAPDAARTGSSAR